MTRTENRKCEGCIHESACKRWIAHGKLLYDDFEYSVEDCPDYAPRCKDCVWCSKVQGPHCVHPSGGMYEVEPHYFCCHGERKDNV